MNHFLHNTYKKLPEKLQKNIKTNYTAFSNIKFSLLIFAGKFKRVFIRPHLPSSKKIQVHLGCGPINHPDFINIDGFPFPHVHYVSRIDKLPMLNDSSVDLIYASHCLEHFHYNSVTEVLSEWCRVLKPTGEIYISVPDVDKLIAIYKKFNNDPDLIMEQLMGGQNNKYNYHYTVFNHINLAKKLQEVGFNSIEEWRAPYDVGGVLKDFSSYEKLVGNESFPVSLNIKAKKNATKV